MIRDNHSESLTLYLSNIRAASPLSREDEVRLARRAGDGQLEARDRLVRANLAFVVKVAKDYRNLGVPFEELINEGNLGLIEAVRRFDPDKGARFITCAIWWIRKFILKAVSDQAGPVRVPAYQQRRAREARREETARDPELRSGCSPAKISTGSEPTVVRFPHFEAAAVSADGGESPLAERLAQPEDENPELDYIARERRRWVREAVRGLGRRERHVITSRYGLGGARAV